MRLFKSLLLTLLVIGTFNSCKKDGSTATDLPVVITSNPIVSDTEIILSGEVTFTDGENSTKRGVCWSESTNPTTNDQFYLDDATGMGVFSANVISQLKPNTKYYVRAYAENSVGKVYSDVEKSFTTKGLAFINSSGCVECDKLAIGDKFKLEGIEYTVADREMLDKALANGEDLTKFCTSNVEDMSKLFKDATTFNEDIGNWDVSKVKFMNFMFQNAQAFNQDIGNWDVSNVTYTSAMFYKSAFNKNISDWDVSNVTNMAFMFAESAFNKDIGNWDVSKVTDMNSMFQNAQAFNQDIGSWDVSNVTIMSWMFRGAQAFDQNIGKWDVSNVSNMLALFIDAKAFNQDIGNWDVSKVTDMNSMFLRSSAFNQDLSEWCVKNIETIPNGFSDGSLLTSKNHPVWGTCP